jgi:hypothetical protein
VQETGDTDGVGELHRQAAEELHLAEHAGGGLHVDHACHIAAHLVEDGSAPGAAIDHHPVPGNEHVIKDNDTVHLFEAAAEGMIEAVSQRWRYRFAANEF